MKNKIYVLITEKGDSRQSFRTREEAEKEAYYSAIEKYESYDGLHGLRTVDDIMEEDEIDQDEAEQVYNDERESWLEYYVKPDDGKED